jgi:hypothetical protein
LSATWTKLALTCTKTLDILNGDATFTLPTIDPILSISDTGVEVQGVIDNATNQITVEVPYTAGEGTYDAYTSTVTAIGEADTNGISISYPGGQFAASGTIPVTFTVDGDGTFNVQKQLFNVLATIGTFDFPVNGVSQGNLVLQASGGITDRNFADADHKFIYTSVTNPTTGRTWLGNNLGAHYSNMNHASYDPTAQATAHNDYNAYGSLFQWGRYGDGHELINWTSATAGTPVVSGTTSTKSTTPTPATNQFITSITSWYTGSDVLWQGEGGINNPCPSGYRLATKTELDSERLSWSSNNRLGAFASALKFTTPGFRERSVSDLRFIGIASWNWSSTVNTRLSFDSNSSNTNTGDTAAYGFSVRCIKD